MKQGYSGSSVQKIGNLVEKITTDPDFVSSTARQQDLIALSRKIPVLPRIDHVDHQAIYMDYIEGQEELTEQNALQAGKSLRLLHDQLDYPHICVNGINWLVQMANENLAQMGYSERIPVEIEAEYPLDVLIHSEPAQIIEKQDGTIVFIDIEGIGMGSRYQDLGFIYYIAMRDEKPQIYAAFMSGYQSQPVQVATVRVKKIAGIIALAYAAFFDAEKRIQLGLRLWNEMAKE